MQKSGVWFLHPSSTQNVPQTTKIYNWALPIIPQEFASEKFPSMANIPRQTSSTCHNSRFGDLLCSPSWCLIFCEWWASTATTWSKHLCRPNLIKPIQLAKTATHLLADGKGQESKYDGRATFGNIELMWIWIIIWYWFLTFLFFLK